MAKKNKSWDLAVLIFVIICLLVGWFIKTGIEAQTIHFTDTSAGISLNYPATWLPSPDKEAILSVVDPRSQSVFSTRLTITMNRGFSDVGMDDFIARLQEWRESSHTLYRSISINPYQIGSLNTTKLEYAYATYPAEMTVPRIVHALDIIAPKGEHIYIFTFAADENEYAKSLVTFNGIMKSIRMD